MSNESLNWTWVFISVLIFLVSQAVINTVFAIFGILTLGIGFILFIIAKPIAYFIGGYITGMLSPGLTIKEPAIGAAIVAVGGVLFDAGTMYPGRIIGLILSGIVAFILATAGAQMGERVSQ